MLFSHRKGLKSEKVAIQTEGLSKELRNGLWDAFKVSFVDHVRIQDYHHPSEDHSITNLISSFWHGHFKIPLDTIPNWGETYNRLRKYFFECKWNEVYDFIEFSSKNYSVKQQHYPDYQAKEDTEKRRNRFTSMCNTVLQRENSAYRFVNREITQITSEEEISSIEDASRTAFKNTNTHIQSALALMSDKKNPDFRNSIKESISAVEATCNEILGDSSKSLGQALTELERKNIVVFHKAKKTAFSALYGYTSAADGIRHALLDESTLDFDDAKFMLVSCSAFCNLLISKTKD